MEDVVISFSHTNYCIRSAGTEKFIRDLTNDLQLKGIHHLNFFSFYDEKKRMKDKKIGVNFDNQFVAIYSYSKLAEVIDALIVKYELRVTAVHLQHLLHHDLKCLSAVLLKLLVPVYLIVHDYYLLCPELKLISDRNGFCGVSRPSAEKCAGCKFADQAMVHKQNVDLFLASIKSCIAGIITPSSYVTTRMQIAFPELSDLIITRPHLKLTGQKRYQALESKIKVAYLGTQTAAKGFYDWKRLVNLLSDQPQYEFYYFGTGEEQVDGVKNIFVSSVEQGENAMVNALKRHEIDVAFVWPNWAETYSYVFYELSSCGVFVVTNLISGNIYDEICKKQNGIVFEGIQECVEWFKDNTVVRDAVNQYKLYGEFRPAHMEVNHSLADLLSDKKTYSLCKKKVCIPSVLHTAAYRVLYHKKLKRKI